MADDSHILQKRCTRVWMWSDFGSVQLYSAQSTENFYEIFRSISPSTAGMLMATFAKYPRYWTIWDPSFGVVGKQRRLRMTSNSGASCSWAFIISPVSSSPPRGNHCLSANTGVCLRKWSLDVCLIWTSSATEHAAQRVWVTLTKQLPPPYHGLQKDWKESSIRDLSFERCSVPMPGLPISPNSLFHQGSFAFVLATQDSLATSWVWRSHEGKGGVEDGPLCPCCFLVFLDGGMFLPMTILPLWQP